MANSQVTRTERLDRTLQAAVVQSWEELMPGSPSGQIHVEYQTGSNGALEFLRIWSSSVRGHWDLICEMWLQALWSNAVGLRFANNYRSAALTTALGVATQDAGPGSTLPDHQGFIQVQRPTAELRTDTPIFQTATAAV
jgi:hypothetical protein